MIKNKWKNAGKAIIFISILTILCVRLGYLFRPAWYEWNNYDTTHGFYEEPENTIETIFLGASIVVSGITPMELYEDYGICAYNLGTEQQPMLASYYWLQEVYRLHPESLKTVVLDVSMLRTVPDLELYRKAIEPMQLSPIKYQAVRDYTGSLEETMLYINPLTAYHSRWSSLELEDFNKMNYVTNVSVRGYHFSTQQYMDSVLALGNWHEAIAVPMYYVDATAQETEFNSESLFYLNKIIEFCEDKDIKLVFIKTPVIDFWSSADHNAVESIADRYQLDFLDFNYEPLLGQITYNNAVDSLDGVHLNYYGATKLTDWMGQYLVEHCQATDVRGNEKYDYLESQLEEYNKQVMEIVSLVGEKDPVDYLTRSTENGDYTIFIMVKDEAVTSISQEQRMGFADLGLVKLSQLQFRDSYLAIIDKGKVVYEDSKCFVDIDVNEENELTVPKNDLEDIKFDKDNVGEKEDIELSLFYKGELNDGNIFVIKSGGTYLGNIASCMINGEEYAPNQRGLNIVIYDNAHHKVVDATCFDTYLSENRSSVNKRIALTEAIEDGKTFAELSKELQELYLYNLKCEKAKELLSEKESFYEKGMLNFIDYYQNKKDIIIFISAMDEAAGMLEDDARRAFEKLGLINLSLLEFRDSYIAVIYDGQVLHEQKDHGEEPITLDMIDYSLISAGADSGNISSIKIGGIEYSMMQRGFNIVVYDKVLEEVIDRASFDTCAIPVKVE